VKVIRATDGSETADEANVFERVVCGIDGSPESLEALRQVERLRPAGGSLHLATVAELSLAVHGGFAAPSIYDRIASEAESALARAAEHSGATSSRLFEGEPAHVLRREIERGKATAVALGSHGHRRAAGIFLGNTATTLLHEVPCSVLLARRPASLHDFPSSITVGVDGSVPSLRALSAAQELGNRLGAPVRVLVATGGKPPDLDGLRGIQHLDWDEGKPVEALVGASHGTDLIVVGSRGLHGLSALGSVSERVAHRAASSVLVVRTP
jgi:nucleotide-binding universal stress UspA family protein